MSELEQTPTPESNATALEALVEQLVPPTTEGSIIAGLTDEQALGVLQRCAIIRDVHIALPKLSISISPAHLGLPAELVDDLSQVMTNGQIYLLPKSIVNRLRSCYARIQSWVRTNSIPSVFGPLITARQWQPENHYTPDPKIDEPKGSTSTFCEMFDYTKLYFANLLEDIRVNYDTYKAQMQAEYREVAVGIYTTVCATIAANERAYPNYTRCKLNGVWVPASNGKAITQDQFIANFWGLVEKEMLGANAYAISTPENPTRFTCTYLIAEVPLPFFTQPEDFNVFSADVKNGTPPRQQSINAVLDALLSRTYEYLAATAKQLLTSADQETGVLPPRTLSTLRVMCKNIRRLNLLDNEQLAALATNLEQLTSEPASTRDWGAIQTALQEQLTFAFEASTAMELSSTRRIQEILEVEPAPEEEVVLRVPVLEDAPPVPIVEATPLRRLSADNVVIEENEVVEEEAAPAPVEEEPPAPIEEVPPVVEASPEPTLVEPEVPVEAPVEVAPPVVEPEPPVEVEPVVAPQPPVLPPKEKEPTQAQLDAWNRLPMFMRDSISPMSL